MVSAWNSAGGGMDTLPTNGSYGLFLPDIGTILLNGDALDLNRCPRNKFRNSSTSNTNGK